MAFDTRLTQKVADTGWGDVDRFVRDARPTAEDLVVGLLAALAAWPVGLPDALDLIESRTDPKLRAQLARRVPGSGLGPEVEAVLLTVALPEAAPRLRAALPRGAPALVALLDRLGAGTFRQATLVEWLLAEIGTEDAARAVVDVVRRCTPAQLGVIGPAAARGAALAPDEVDPILATLAPADDDVWAGWWGWIGREGHPAVVDAPPTQRRPSGSLGLRHPLSIGARRALGPAWPTRVPASRGVLDRLDAELAASPPRVVRRVPALLAWLRSSTDDDAADRVLARLAMGVREARWALADRVVARGRPLAADVRERLRAAIPEWPMADGVLGAALALYDRPDEAEVALAGMDALSIDECARVHDVAVGWPDASAPLLTRLYRRLSDDRLAPLLSGDGPTSDAARAAWANVALERPPLAERVVGRLERTGSAGTAALVTVLERCPVEATRRAVIDALGRVGHLGALPTVRAAIQAGGLLEPPARAAHAAIVSRHPAPEGSVSTGVAEGGAVGLADAAVAAPPLALPSPGVGAWAALRAPPRELGWLVVASHLGHGNRWTAGLGYGVVAATATVARVTTLDTFPTVWGVMGMLLGAVLIGFDLWIGWGKLQFLQTAELGASSEWTESVRSVEERQGKRTVRRDELWRRYLVNTASGRRVTLELPFPFGEEAPVWFLVGPRAQRVGEVAAHVGRDGELRAHGGRVVVAFALPAVAAVCLFAWLG